jgi:hypothetical protein
MLWLGLSNALLTHFSLVSSLTKGTRQTTQIHWYVDVGVFAQVLGYTGGVGLGPKGSADAGCQSARYAGAPRRVGRPTSCTDKIPAVASRPVDAVLSSYPLCPPHVPEIHRGTAPFAWRARTRDAALGSVPRRGRQAGIIGRAVWLSAAPRRLSGGDIGKATTC